MNPEPETVAAPSLKERIGALMPDHAYVAGAGPFTGKWQWSTPAGMWRVVAAFPLLDKRTITLSGAGVDITLPGTDVGFRALHAAMVALGAIPDLAAVGDERGR